jgi:hypothetical protein
LWVIESLLNTAYAIQSDLSYFCDAREQLDALIIELESEAFGHIEHGEIEQHINQQGHELMRRLLQGHFNLQASKESRVPVVNADTDAPLNQVRKNTRRTLMSQFGEVTVTRKSYGQRGEASHFPLDEQLNLPKDRYSDGLRQQAALEALKGSYDNAVESIDNTTAGHIPKRQSMNVVQDVSQDFEAFYQQERFKVPEETKDLLVLAFDGKGIVMRKEGLREGTRKAAEASKKLNSRLSPGEKKDRKRMAMVAAVYTVTPHERTAESIMKIEETSDKVLPFRAPVRNKRVWASLEREAEDVIREAFQEALQRDPEQKRSWVVLIDGLPHQIRLVNKVKSEMKLKATIVMDFIHVLEYLWKAAWCFFEKGDVAVEEWIAERAIKILQGKCVQVAKGIRLSATRRALTVREGVDKCADYLLKNKSRLKYGEALKNGFPIASGVIEGACRHLINDRLDITGSRWSLLGAEAVLKLRSLKSSRDFKNYWTFHKRQSKERLYSSFQIMAKC